MGFADVHQELVDEAPDQLTLGVDTGDQLGDDLEPRVDVDGADALHERLVDFGPVAVVEPQRQEPQRILQRAAVR